MKRLILPTLSTLAFFALLAGFMNGPANRGDDKTGSPLSNGQCMNCHSSGNFSPSLSIKMLSDGLEVNRYEPGKTYQLRYETSVTGSPAGFGFQTVALNSSDENMGVFSNIPAGFHQILLGNASYVEHTSPRPENFFTVDWTAPANAVDVVKFYAGSVAANGNNSTSQDGGVVSLLEIQPNTSAVDQPALVSSPIFHLNNTLATNDLNVKLRKGVSEIVYTIINDNGRIIKNETIRSGSQNEQRISVTDLNPGMYYIHIQQAKENHTERFLKM